MKVSWESGRRPYSLLKLTQRPRGKGDEKASRGVFDRILPSVRLVYFRKRPLRPRRMQGPLPVRAICRAFCSAGGRGKVLLPMLRLDDARDELG